MEETGNKIIQEEDYKSGPVQYIDSREVAEIVGKAHNELLKDIRRYCKQFSLGNIPQSNFFIESTYRTERGKDYPCYLVTKKGCEFIANKLTGQKGTEFTAKFINRFHDMEDKLTNIKVIQQFMEQQIKTNQIQAEFNQIIMERLEHLGKPAINSYKGNPFLTFSDNNIEERKENLYTLTAELAELWGYQHMRVLHCLYNALEKDLGIVLDCYKSVYRSETGRQDAGMTEVIAYHDWIYKEAVKMCEYAIDEKKIFK